MRKKSRILNTTIGRKNKMRKVSCILLAVVAFLGLQAAANSATLQAGWYVDIETVGFCGTRPAIR